ncbi:MULTISPECIES: MarR family transcriptional regulator [unclassified Streptomyces]|uniref:MarR family transcriptional regulator n=1 Tax=unclassified Streptomyces TaxID=2593676 RepID=UPI002E3014F2|nr:MarR family transcriptional regulator [Streptomyces sp. NBC_01268]
MKPTTSVKPIGSWLNRTDRALTRAMDELLAASGLTRLAWQVLNVVRDAPGADGATDADVLTLLAANADAPTLTAAVETVVADGWAARPAPARLALTADGRFRLDAAAERVAAFRTRAASGISPEEYRTAVGVLERMTRNLEGAPAAGRGRG